MPKILQNVREQLLAEAKKQVAEKGYASTTVRSVATACGLATGTVYNYFPSKDMLIASFMAEDWRRCLNAVKQQDNREPETLLRQLFEMLHDFIQQHRTLFQDRDAAKVFATVFSERHKQLRDQVAETLLPICQTASVPDKAFLAAYIAEAMLSWTVAGKSFEAQYPIIRQLLK